MLQQSNLPPAVSRIRINLQGADGNLLSGDLFAPQEPSRGLVLLLHGGGQTRHAWRYTGTALAAEGWTTVALDQRGHGDSAWVEDGDYSFSAYARDLTAASEQLEADFGTAPLLVGASLGGIAGMLARKSNSRGSPLRGLVLVDITPVTREGGTDHIIEFMASNAGSGFDSLEDAADAIARYLPHRPRPKSLNGLKRNLRQGPDGRFRWHWDPRFIDARRLDGRDAERDARLSEAARTLEIPVLLVRGLESELVGDDEVRAFLDLVPHGKAVDVAGARHMVAGDVNDVFTEKVSAFLSETFGDHAKGTR